LALLQVGQQITIQDQNDSANYQVWNITGATTQIVGASNYWEVPVSLISAGGRGTIARAAKDGKAKEHMVNYWIEKIRLICCKIY
jgi:hypothetical protein